MGEMGEIGWYLKLENTATNKVNQNLRKDKEKERIKQPLFQFRFDGYTGKFVRELKESPYIDNATKNPNFVNGRWTSMIGETEQESTNMKNNNLMALAGDVDK